MIIDVLTISGITIIITSSKLFKPFRECLSKRHKPLGDFIGCPMCTGAWVGTCYYLSFYGISILLEHINIKLFFIIFVKNILSYISIGSITSEIMYRIIEKLKI